MLDTHIPIFEGALMELTHSKRDIIYWSKFYYEYVSSKATTERPDDFTVDYDILMDEWVDRKHFIEKAGTANKPLSSADNMNYVVDF